MRLPRAPRSLLAALALLILSACGNSAEVAFQECTIGALAATTSARDERERQNQEILIASPCMRARGYHFDFDQQREDARKHKFRATYAYWHRK